MKISKELMHEYVSTLPNPLWSEVMVEIGSALIKSDLTDQELKEALDNAKNSRVCDLTDTIGINFI